MLGRARPTKPVVGCHSGCRCKRRRTLYPLGRRGGALGPIAAAREGDPAGCRAAVVGKLTPSALYIHTSALSQLPPILRIYERCARTYIGTAEGANLIKLHRGISQVSYLAYPDFERAPPELHGFAHQRLLTT
jgi:hypothetical protein